MNKWDKQPQKISESHHDEHVEQKWLVSYVNMMMLLFGLFVILFSISIENQAQFQDNLKKLSDSTTRNPAQEEKIEQQPDRDWEKELADERTKRESAEEVLEKLTAEMETAHEKLKAAALLEQSYIALQKAINNLNKNQDQVAPQNIDLANILLEKSKMAHEIDQLQDQLRKAKEFELKVAMLEVEVRKTRLLEAKITLLEEDLNKANQLVDAKKEVKRIDKKPKHSERKSGVK